MEPRSPVLTAGEPSISGDTGFRPLGLVYVWPAVLFLVAFFIAPLVGVVARSFEPNLLAGGEDSLSQYHRLLLDSFYLGVIAQTVALSAVVTVICAVLGYAVAYFMVRHAGRYYDLIVFLLIAPLLTSIIMRTFGWRVLFARRGVVNEVLMWIGLTDTPISFLNSAGAVIVGLVHVLVPFMVLSIAAVLQGIDRRLEESSRILGAGRWQTFWRVTLPLSLDGLGTGAILVFMIATGSFVTLLLLGGGGLLTLPLLIYQQFNVTRDFPFAAAMSNILLILGVICLYMQLRLIRRKGIAS